MAETDYAEEYKQKISEELIPLYQVMGNEKFAEFDFNPNAVYKYCIDNNKRWEEVLDYKPDPNVLY